MAIGIGKIERNCGHPSYDNWLFDRFTMKAFGNNAPGS
jgi:hypothetical protein